MVLLSRAAFFFRSAEFPFFFRSSSFFFECSQYALPDTVKMLVSKATVAFFKFYRIFVTIRLQISSERQPICSFLILLYLLLYHTHIPMICLMELCELRGGRVSLQRRELVLQCIHFAKPPPSPYLESIKTHGKHGRRKRILSNIP